MPTYEYRCQNGHDSELFFRKISDAPADVKCSVCGADAVRRVSGGAGLLFKGSGFYLTDYGKNAHRKATTDGAKGDGKGEAKGESSGSDAAAPKGGSDSASAAPAAKAETPQSEPKTPAPKTKSGDGQ